MRINAKLGVQHLAFDGAEAGEGLAIFLSQNSNAASRYRFLVKAMIGQGIFQVGTFYSSPPNATTPTGQLTRMVAAAVCPGATSWAVDVSSADDSPVDETAEVILSSSKCFTSPVGVSRVSERYSYLASNTNVAFTLPPGRVATRISLTALAGGGTFRIDANPIINVPAGVTVALEPKADLNVEPLLTFNNLSWFVECLESA